ncbi:Ribokinase-like protein [Blyttiomyces helicus]|uniref:ATP-dependent (S)-NAD(P)H-hydrate dehydratase n=1 Tax=Blyttiomyces helicus TaxID=388810 RepID=A0A4V1ISB6_9FUNG|nr:Ribokinase-like protein [Blyttiomyces helicus]|eukprot:RKO92987.1 Ribokinase-like protein [Blyttiomyces helicus]
MPGRVAVVGGSVDYTGAPYFAAISAMKTGADLVHVFCEASAGPVIKSYSPDLMVHPYLATTASMSPGVDAFSELDSIYQRIVEVISRGVQAIVIGPGLSRDGTMLETARRIIKMARRSEIPLVLDADALFLIQADFSLIDGYRRAILTPNANEFQRLCASLNIAMEGEGDAAMRLSRALGNVTIVRKGPIDIITNGEEVLECNFPGNSRRCGGQGDLLSGAIGTFVSWALGVPRPPTPLRPLNMTDGDAILTACWGACALIRGAGRAAFEKHRRATLAQDVVGEIGPVFDRMY